jgi:PAS domain S-box-containing protein
VLNGTAKLGRITAISTMSDDPSPAETAIQRFMEEQNQQAGRRKFYHDTYFLLICLITLFVLFFASWSAQILSRQISVPISALLGAAQEVRRGNLSYRVRVNAIDELATLVRAFNEMTSELEANARELEARRRFTEAILESIPTGVISVSADERIERVNRALAGIFPPEVASSAKWLEDLFSPEDLAEIRYLLKRARRTGAAASQLDIQRSSSVLHLAVTVASLEEQRGFVLVLEDTSDLLRAQKSAAWQEVARRIAHEIKNPLTPISLCADRIARQLLRLPMDGSARAILEECTEIIQQEVQTVKSLVDEFSQFSRFPSAQPSAADLNEIVESAMSVFAGRLDGVAVSVDLDRTIPLVLADKEQLKRVIVNLIDNAFEAMNEAPVRKLLLATSHASADTVRFSVSDTGCGISAADKEKLFLPYFSTKDRGTGLGLAIVSHIVTEHHGKVRVEDNRPTGATFIVELNALSPADSALSSDAGDPHPATLKV